MRGEPNSVVSHFASNPADETSDVSGQHPDLTAYLAGRIARTSPGFTQRDRPPRVDPTASGLERPLSDALKALGYIAE